MKVNFQFYVSAQSSQLFVFDRVFMLSFCLVQQGTGPPDHMVSLADKVGAGFMPSTSSPPATASGGGPPEVGSPNVGSSTSVSGGAMGTARVIRAEQKKFFFDLGSNARGQYLRISEVGFVSESLDQLFSMDGDISRPI